MKPISQITNDLKMKNHCIAGIPFNSLVSKIKYKDEIYYSYTEDNPNPNTLHLYLGNEIGIENRICYIEINGQNIVVKQRSVGPTFECCLINKLWKRLGKGQYNGESLTFGNNNIDDLIKALDELVAGQLNKTGGVNMVDTNNGINKIKEEIKAILNHNPQIVLTGAPGTGKTYMAKEICKELLVDESEKLWESIKKEENLAEGKEEYIEKYIKEHIYFVQFHPSYDYTDFVEGLRPVKKRDTIGFERKDGIFMELCREASKKENKEKKYYLIIDEINRADLSKVFGELMYCLEYRGENGRIKTQYNNLMEEDHPFKKGFYVPDNVYIIATMNDIDRSVESFDFALRRRFFWYEVKANDVMEDVVKSMIDNKLTKELVEELIKSAKKLNEDISNKGSDYGLNEHYHLGPAYFGKIEGLLEDDAIKITDNEKLKYIKEKIWKYRVEPILREYVRGYEGVDDFIKELKESFILETLSKEGNLKGSDGTGNENTPDTNKK